MHSATEAMSLLNEQRNKTQSRNSLFSSLACLFGWKQLMAPDLFIAFVSFMHFFVEHENKIHVLEILVVLPRPCTGPFYIIRHVSSIVLAKYRKIDIFLFCHFYILQVVLEMPSIDDLKGPVFFQISHAKLSNGQCHICE